MGTSRGRPSGTRGAPRPASFSASPWPPPFRYPHPLLNYPSTPWTFWRFLPPPGASCCLLGIPGAYESFFGISLGPPGTSRRLSGPHGAPSDLDLLGVFWNAGFPPAPDNPRSLYDGPETAQKAPKTAPRWLKKTPKLHKRAPRQPQDGLGWPQKQPSRSPRSPRRPKQAPKTDSQSVRRPKKALKRHRRIPRGSEAHPSNVPFAVRLPREGNR